MLLCEVCTYRRVFHAMMAKVATEKYLPLILVAKNAQYAITNERKKKTWMKNKMMFSLELFSCDEFCEWMFQESVDTKCAQERVRMRWECEISGWRPRKVNTIAIYI